MKLPIRKLPATLTALAAVVLATIGITAAPAASALLGKIVAQANDIDAVVVPMGVKADDYAGFIKSLARLTNLRGALVTMPHKITTVALMDEVSVTAQIAGACNAILLRPDGTLLGDMFDGAGFVRGVLRKGQAIAGRSALVVGSGGVGSAIAASLAEAGAARLGLFDAHAQAAEAVGARLRIHYPMLDLVVGTKDPAGFDIVVNATPLGMNLGDPLPFDIDRIAASAFVGEVVMKEEHTPLLRQALAKGCRIQVGTDMLFEQIPAYLEFFGFGTTTPEQLRAVARLQY
jgi:shikimate dehydrogenase